MKEATVDIETDGLDATVIWCAAVLDHQTGEVREFTPDTILQLPMYLETYDTLYGHNIIDFDLSVLRNLLGWEYSGRVIDTMYVSRALQPERVLPPTVQDRRVGPHSVEAWGHRLGDKKLEHEDWSRYTPAMLERCVQDVRLQHRIWGALQDELEESTWTINNLRLVCKTFSILRRQYDRGWHVDRDHLTWGIGYLTRYMARIERALEPHLPPILERLETRFPTDEREEKGEWRYVSTPFNQNGTVSKRASEYLGGQACFLAGPFSRVRSRPISLDKRTEIIDYLLREGWIPKEWNVDKSTGARTSPKLTLRDPFEGVTGKVPTLATKYLQAKQRRGTLEGWLTAIGDGNLIYGSHSGLATTGRLKHSVVVNVPGADADFGWIMRRVFSHRPGYTLVGVDSAGNQMRQLAARIKKHVHPDGDREFEEAVLHGSSSDGTDLHSLNQRRSGVATRTLAKGFFYGAILFGAGDPKTAKLLNSTAEHAKRLKAEYFEKMPMLRTLIDRLTNEWRGNAKRRINKWGKIEYYDGWITGLDGRPIHIEQEHTVLVYVLQSDEAIQMAAAYCWVYEKLLREGYEWDKDWAYVIWYHDEYIVECRPDIADRVQEIMEEGIAWAGRHFNILTPHAGTGSQGANWYDVH